MKLKKLSQPTLKVDMTPMIDCVFLLLIFFMVVSTMSKVDMTPEIELPVAPKAAVPEDLRARGIINILPNGFETAAGEIVAEDNGDAANDEDDGDWSDDGSWESVESDDDDQAADEGPGSMTTRAIHRFFEDASRRDS